MKTWQTSAAAFSMSLLMSSFSFHAVADSKSETGRKRASEMVPGQYIVEIKDAQNFSATRLKATVIEKIRPNLFLVQRDVNESKSHALEILRANAFIQKADPNYIMRISRTPNDTDFGKLWGLHNGGELDSTGIRGLKGVDIGAEKAWEKSTGSKDVIVAVIDTGIDFKIPDLAGNAWVNQAEANGKAGVDDDNNGYIDDIHGYNFSEDKGDATDDNGHGSHCAGTIGARGDDGVGVAGVNWNVSLMAVKFLNAEGSGTLANALKAIDYARKNGAHILSNSWGGGDFTQTLYDTILETQKAGELFVAAAGNDGGDNDVQAAYPASYKIDNIVSVAALDQRGQLADFSNYGLTSVHIAAPGVNIYSSTPTGFEYLSGTSMATPHVSGAAALILADNPKLGYLELKKRLLESARPLRSLKGKLSSGGILDISYALLGGQPPQDPNDASLWSFSAPQTVSSPHPYGDKLDQTYTVTVPGATRLAVHFSKFETESNYDTVKFYNKAGELLGVMSGTATDSYSPIADGDTIILKIKSDESVNGYGFDVDSAAFEKAVGP